MKMNLKKKNRILWIAFSASIFFHGLFFVLFKVKDLQAMVENEYIEIGLIETGWSEPFLELPGDSFDEKALFEKPESLNAELSKDELLDKKEKEEIGLPEIREKENVFIDIEMPKDKMSKIPEKTHGMGVSEVQEKPTIQGPAAQRDVLFKKYPNYPLWAQRYGLEFEVRLKFWLTSGGDVDWVVIEASSGYPEVDAEVIRAMKRWRFSSIEGNERQWGTILFKFRLRH